MLTGRPVGAASAPVPAEPADATTTISSTSDAATAVLLGTATSTASAWVNRNAESAMSWNTRAGSSPPNSSVAISRVASIHVRRSRDCA